MGQRKPVVRSHDPNATLSLIESSLHGYHENATASSMFVCVGDTIEVEDMEAALRGHGTQLLSQGDEKRIVATLCGIVERVNKLVYVRPLKTRYKAELGDVVVGRVTEVAGKKWKVDISAVQEASLLLSAVNLPGAIQRRRTAEDELAMRSIFREGDLVSAEVQSLHQDGGVALQTRTLKFGRLVAGQLVHVAPSLVKRQKQHFVVLQAQRVELILGVNGAIWVAPYVQRREDGSLPEQLPAFDVEARSAVCRTAAAIRALARLYLLVHPAAIGAAYELSVQRGVAVQDMTELQFLAELIEAERQRREAAVAADRMG